MIKEFNLRVEPQIAANEASLKHFICLEKGLKGQSVKAIQVIKRSIDARQRKVFFQMQVRVFINELPQEQKIEPFRYQDVSQKAPVIVVGAGPAGLFAALRLIELGRKPIVVERGKNVSDRKRDLASAVRMHHIHPESNYCFGEGGAGTFSDGKLNTGVNNVRIGWILEQFVKAGAREDILFDAKPHIGTDVLLEVVQNLRQRIIGIGIGIEFLEEKYQLIKDIQVDLANLYYKVPLFSSNVTSVARTDRFTGFVADESQTAFNLSSLQNVEFIGDKK